MRAGTSTLTARARHRTLAALTALLLPVAALLGLAAAATPASAAESVTATYAKTSDWGTGFEAKWTVKNTGTTTLTGWTLEWDFPSGTTAGTAWDATLTHTGNHYTAKNASYNDTLAPGATASFGFDGTGSGSPTGCALNGASCDGSTTPPPAGDNPPSAPGAPTASAVTDTSVKLSWTAATDDKGVRNYDVLRDGATVATVTSTSWSDTGLTAGTAYSYTVKARDTAGQVGPAGPATTVHTTGGGGTTPPPSGSKVRLGYFTEWGTYGRNFNVKNLVTSGSAAKVTHINYAFGNVTGGRCAIGDSYADYDKAFTADQAVNGTADTWDQPLRGNFNQLKELKAKYPNIKIIWSFGGWTWSGGFGDAAKNPAAFAQSCYDLVNDSRWAGLFDGIDIDWEYPNACGLSCDTSGASAFKTVLAALRAKFGTSKLVTAAITADGSDGGKIDATDYAGASAYVDFYNVMTYDFFGAWDAQGPTAPHSPLTSYSGIPKQGFDTADAIAKLKAQGVPAGKLNLGVGFYGRGWTGVTQDAPGGTATGPAPGTYEQGIEDYKVLKTSCPATGTIAGTAYVHCGTQWWSYDTPSTVAGKMSWAKTQGLAGAFFWDFSGDTANGELATAVDNGLK